MIRFEQEVCADLAQASRLEWLETNGLGGFASSTITGMNTRRYHALLVAAVSPPCGRAVLLSKLEEVLIVGENRFNLATNQYPGTVYPDGFCRQKRFRLDPYPIFTFEAEGVTIEKHVCMVRGEDTTVIRYKIFGEAAVLVRLEVRPLIAFRDYHALTRENDAIHRTVQQVRGRASVTPYPGMPTLHLAHNASGVGTKGDWYRNFQYACEQERGLDFEEDLFNPFCLSFTLSATHVATIIASTQVRKVMDAEPLIAAEVDRRSTLTSAAPDTGPLRQLALAADQFIVRRGEQKTVIAGYQWFGDWGRDTMIALPGLTLTTGRVADAKDVLLEFSRYVDQGMLPNRFPEAGVKPEYNTVDATLWYFEAIRAYHAATSDDAFVRQLFPVLLGIIEWHVKGTRYGIHMEPDTGLLHAGEPGVQLTWMDAKLGDWVVTPRTGRPVEIQALWYNALRIMQEFATRWGDATNRLRFDAMAGHTSDSFSRSFWNSDDRCLYDVVDTVPDHSIRPNQILAVSLHHSMLSPDESRKVVSTVRRELLTPFGLRTLSTADPRYVGNYQGDQRSRDAAYHQGTVWPWLIGPFIEAYLKVNDNGTDSKKQAAEWLQPLIEHLNAAGLGTISEIFEGDEPHRPCGCIAQAWSVAELLRAVKMVA
jgi:predicted glycogen debranching enzyme